MGGEVDLREIFSGVQIKKHRGRGKTVSGRITWRRSGAIGYFPFPVMFPRLFIASHVECQIPKREI